ncbi:MAG: CPBP family glutamic-type intramembrane protease [Planctomycetota bacterium]
MARKRSLSRAAEGYWAESRQPLASLVFIAPLLVGYEAGVLVLGPDVVRNGAEVWLRQLLKPVGFGQYFLLPVLTVCILLGWHYTTRRPWRLRRGLLWGMAGECLLLTIALWLLAQLQGILLQAVARPTVLSIPSFIEEIVGDAVRYLGAGIYEELLFRLILLSLAAWGLGRLGLGPRQRLVAAVVITSLSFSFAHHVGQHGEPFEWDNFLFRFLAGVFFSILFVYRGFGIAAGTHAGYDILVGFFAPA